jgi:hypothetical protein
LFSSIRESVVEIKVLFKGKANQILLPQREIAVTIPKTSPEREISGHQLFPGFKAASV